MPLVMQLWNIYRSRALGHWLNENEVQIIPNIRFGDQRTFDCSCSGIPQHSVISLGSHGTLKCKNDRIIFTQGIDFIVKKLNPKAIIIYGAAPTEIFSKFKNQGITIIQFESDYAKSHKEAV